jgi:LPXTG-site transpeptidase (sortase) family protein
MDVPRSGSQVGWYALGARPGEAGNAVIAGHLDTALGTPAVFWNLNDLSEKDDVFVLDDFGHEYHFQVVKSVVYNAREAPLQQIFGASIAKNLQLITCNGAWQADEKSYDKRLVVYTNLVQD